MIKLINILNEINSSKFKIYLDMDGVLVNFNKGYYDLTGIDITNNYLKGNKFWNPIHKKGEKFWYNLEWLDDGKKLYDYLEKYKPELLSAPSKNISSSIGKQKWVDFNLPGVKLNLCPSNLKYKYSDFNHVLIDDRKDIIDKWNEYGGIGILYTSFNECLKELQNYNI